MAARAAAEKERERECGATSCGESLRLAVGSPTGSVVAWAVRLHNDIWTHSPRPEAHLSATSEPCISQQVDTLLSDEWNNSI